MRFSVLKQFERKLARGAAIALVGGLAASCSSDVTRFQDSIFTGSTNRNSQVATGASQPYPGDGSYQAASVNRPNGMVGGGGASSGSLAPVQTAAAAPLSDVQRQPIAQSGQPTPALAPVASASPALDPGITNTTRQPQASDVQTVSLPQQQGNQAGRDGAGSTVTVSSGETIYGLSRRYGVPAEAILRANGMSDASNLQAGQKITIPTYAYSREAPVSAPDNNPKVASAQAFPSNAAKMPTQNQPQPNQVPGEQMAVLPQVPRADERKASDQARQDPTTGKPTQEGAYTVAAGDTLYGIARKTGVSADRIKAANSLSDGYLQIGQKLQIPSGTATAYTQVAAATPKAPDPIVTDTAKPAQEMKAEKVSAYTPPAKQTSVSEEADGEQVAALPPDSTGISRLRWPVRGRVVSNFGAGVGSASNDGIDIGVPEGTPVKAAENGVVIYAGDGLKEFGKTVLVRHEDGLVTVYGHASDIKVKRGDTVRRGQEIALSGMSGNADRPKLHFEVRKDSAPVDPVKFLEN